MANLDLDSIGICSCINSERTTLDDPEGFASVTLTFEEIESQEPIKTIGYFVKNSKTMQRYFKINPPGIFRTANSANQRARFFSVTPDWLNENKNVENQICNDIKTFKFLSTKLNFFFI